MRYALTASVGSWYSYSLAFSPIVEVKLSQPVTLGDFFAEWVWPTRNLVAAATGRREEITYLTCTPVFGGEPRPPRLRHFQVFNPSITQEPYGSTNDLREKVNRPGMSGDFDVPRVSWSRVAGFQATSWVVW